MSNKVLKFFLLTIPLKFTLTLYATIKTYGQRNICGLWGLSIDNHRFVLVTQPELPGVPLPLS